MPLPAPTTTAVPDIAAWLDALGFGPVVTAATSNQYWSIGQAVSLRLAANTFTDTLGLAMTYRATLSNGAALPGWLSFNASTETFSGTVPLGAGPLSLTVSATDAWGMTRSEQFTVGMISAATTVTHTAPKLTAQTANQIWVPGVAETLTLSSTTFTDPQSSAMTYAATLSNGSALPSWLKFNATTRSFTGTAPANTGLVTVKVTATDTFGLASSETFTIGLAAAPNVTAATGAQYWVAGKATTLTLPSNSFTDPQGAAMTYTATLASGAALPSWLKFNAATDSFSGTEAAGTAPITIKVTATDSYGLSTSESFTLTLASAPVVVSQTAAQSWTQGKAVSFTLPAGTFKDPQGASLSYSATLSTGAALPTWLKFNATTGAFTGTEPSGTSAFSIKVTATDSYGLATSETFAVATPAAATPTVAASGLVINITYDASVSSAPTGFTAAINAAVAYLEKEFTNNMTLNLKVGYGEVGGTTMGAGALGESETSFDLVTYAQLRSALAAHATQPDQVTALATLPTTSPGTGSFAVANAEAKALGLVAATGTTLDGSIGIASLYPMTYDPANRAVSGLYDAIGVIEHEITEVMGRTQSLSAISGYDSPLDLFRYSSAGVRDLLPGAGSFSINGTTMLQTYNNPTTGGDAADWASSVVGDSFGSGRAGVASLVSAVDLQEMNVLGYTRASLTA